MFESNDMFFKDYGIESNHTIPEHPGEAFYVADTIRALLDLLETNNFAIAQGMNEDFICNDKYDTIVFDKVSMMRTLPNWDKIDVFMEDEYRLKWLEYKKNTHQEIHKRPSLSAKENHSARIPLEQLAIITEQSYVSRNEIRDLYDLVEICKNHWNELSRPVKSMIQNGFERKGLEYFEYLITIQDDKMLDNIRLKNDLSDILKRLDIID
jgi:hypothetical protein